MNALRWLRTVFCYGWMPLYFGGDSDSDSSVQTTNNTENNAWSTDKRVVASDAAIGIGGDGNTINRSDSTTSSTSFSDSSNRSTNFADNSNRSTNFSDSSQRDSGNTTSITTTDFGSVAKALDSVTMMGRGALDVSDHSITGAIDTLKRIADNNQLSVKAAFDAARGTAADSVRTAQDALAFATKNTSLTNAAFAEAKNGPDTNKTVMLAALAVVGVVGAAMAFKKG